MIAEPKFSGGCGAAFLDLDGTLLPGPSLEWRLFSALRKGRRISLANYFRWAGKAVCLLSKGPLAARYENKKYLAGVQTDLAWRYLDSIIFFDEGIARVVWHAQEGHRICLVTGTLEPLAQLAATALECELEARGISVRPRLCATRVATERGRWTGEVAGRAIYGQAKARCVQTIAVDEGVDLRKSHAYGNSLLDGHFLASVGYAHAVNPDRELAALAKQKNWRVWHWQRESTAASPQTARLSQKILSSKESA
jgi:phosphoserine phosphatase